MPRIIGRPVQALAHLDDALVMHHAMGARPSVARTQYARASSTLARGEPGDQDAGVAALDEVLAEARSLGVMRLVELAEALQRRTGLPARQDAAR